VLQSVPVGLPPRLVEAGDLDGDTDLDLLVLAQDADTTRTLVLRNHGAAGFGQWWFEDIDWPVPTWGLDLELGDVDGDADLDLVLLVPIYGLLVRFNAGDGTFDAFGAPSDQGLNVDNELADIDGDSILDIAHYELDLGGYVGSRRGNGDGTFALMVDLPLFPPNQADLRMALAELTGDGLTDMLLAANTGLYLVRGQSIPPFFPSWQTPALLLASGTFRDVTTAGLNGDSLTDIVATRPNAGEVAVLLGQTGGLAAPVLYPAGLLPAAIAVADLDADGAPDVVVANQRGATISLLAGDGRGGLLAPTSTKVGRQLTDVTPADLDGDGDVDLAVTDAISASVVLMRNQLVP